MDQPLYFYLARLIDADGNQLASEEVWIADPADPESTPERVALDAAAFFDAEHHTDPTCHTVRLFGPYLADRPAHAFTVADATADGDDCWTVTPVAA